MKLLLLFALVAAVSSSVLLKKSHPLEGQWQTTAVRAASQTQLQVTIHLVQPGNNAISALFDEVVYPDSPKFRNWATTEQLQTLTAPHVSSVRAVSSWLHENKVAHSVVGSHIILNIPVYVAERLFETQFHVVENSKTKQAWQRAGDIFVPESVAPHISAIFGLHGLPTPPRRNIRTPNAIIDVGPTEIRNTYGITGRGSGTNASRQAVAEFQGEFMNEADLKKFFKKLVNEPKPGDDTVYKFVGNKQSGDGDEALLDIEYIMGLAPGVKTEFWAWRNFDFCTDLKNWTSTIIATKDCPNVFSISYGWQGPLRQIGCGDDEVASIDKDFQTIATSGISIIFASGDSGSSEAGNKLWPSWPASSPFVTAVGSTCFTNRSMDLQEATTQFGSGSGFSSMFAQGSWQRASVTQYFTTEAGKLPPSSYYNASGRATADVSALGEGYKVYIDGSIEIVGGTSASAPAFAAVISLLNDKLVTAGKKTLGFLNPWLYSNANAFTDITLGSDKIDRDGDPIKYGFNCSVGWDPATGLGVPDFPKLVTAAGV